jgi:uncharacterized membrane protein
VALLLLSHHPPEHRHRTVLLGWAGHRVHVCARCLGIASGVLLGVVISACRWTDPLSAGALLVMLLAASLLPVIDFHRQMMGLSESSNPRRLVTGCALGLAIAFSAARLLAAQPIFVLPVPLVLVGYFAWIAASGRRRVRLFGHLRPYVEYYSRCRAEDARRRAACATR